MLLLVGCSGASKATLEGRYTVANGAVTHEYLRGGTMLSASSKSQAPNLMVGSWSSDKGMLDYSLIGVHQPYVQRETTMVTVTDKELTTRKDGSAQKFVRQEPPKGPQRAALVGVWKNQEPGAELALVYGEGDYGLEVVSLKTPVSSWGALAKNGRIGIPMRVTCSDDKTLQEELTDGAGSASRTRTFEIAGDVLTLREGGKPDRKFKRIESLPMGEQTVDESKLQTRSTLARIESPNYRISRNPANHPAVVLVKHKELPPLSLAKVQFFLPCLAAVGGRQNLSLVRLPGAFFASQNDARLRVKKAQLARSQSLQSNRR